MVETKLEYPKALAKIKSVFDWEQYPMDFKEEWYDYIDEEFERREEGFWFYNNGKPTYITGTHYMYLQWSPKLMLGQPDYREVKQNILLILGSLQSRCPMLRYGVP